MTRLLPFVAGDSARHYAHVVGGESASSIVARILTRPLTCGLVMSVIACTPDVAESPHASLLQLARAVQTGDTATTLRYVDVDAVAARLLADVLATARDSLHWSADDTLSADFRARIDSIKTEWGGILRTDLGLTRGMSSDTSPSDAEPDALDEREPLDRDGILAEGAEIVGDGAVRFAGDTALVERFIRYALLDTSVTLTLALVPVERAHWRVVALHNPLPLVAALQQRQRAILTRANEPLRDLISAHLSVRDLTISREPLEEWDRYATVVRAVIANRRSTFLVLYSAHIVGPRLSLGDSVGQMLAQPLVLPPGEARPVVWRHPTRGEHPGPYDVAYRPQLYTVEVADMKAGGSPPRRIQLYSTWRDFVDRNPLPAGSSGGVLASLNPLAPISLAVGGVVLLTGAVAALPHDDWFASHDIERN